MERLAELKKQLAANCFFKLAIDGEQGSRGLREKSSNRSQLIIRFRIDNLQGMFAAS
jgi:hypothetical protein